MRARSVGKNCQLYNNSMYTIMQLVITLPPPPPRFPLPPKKLHNHCFQFLLGITVVLREIEDNGYAKFFGNKQGGVLRSMWKRWKPEWALLTHSVKCVVQTLNASTIKTVGCKLERMHNSSREDWKKSVLSIFQNIPSFQSYRLLLFVSILR